jgi:hypothetical protein
MIDELKGLGRRRFWTNGGTTPAFIWRDWNVYLFVLK